MSCLYIYFKLVLYCIYICIYNIIARDCLYVFICFGYFNYKFIKFEINLEGYFIKSVISVDIYVIFNILVDNIINILSVIVVYALVLVLLCL